MSKKILIAGNFGFHNIGDEAILSSMISGFRERDTKISLCVLSGDPENTKASFAVDAIFWKNIPAILEEMQKSDLILLGGGGIFNDYWGVDPKNILTRDHAGISYYSEIAISADLLDKPLMIFAAGVGPVETKSGQELTKLTFKIAQKSTLRDQESKKILVDLGCANSELVVTSDPAFSLQPDLDKGKALLSEFIVDNKLPKVAICLRNWDINCDQHEWQKKVAEGLDRFSTAFPANLIFIPFHNLPEFPITDDLQAAKSVITNMSSSSRKKILQGSLSPEVIAGVISHCDLLVGMRLHSLIFAASAKIPAVGLIYDPKVRILMNHMGIQSYAIEIDKVTPDNLLLSIEKGIHDKNQIKTLLETKIVAQQKSDNKNFDIAMDLLVPGHKTVHQMNHIRNFEKRILLNHALSLFTKEDQLLDYSRKLSEKEEQLTQQGVAFQEKQFQYNEKISNYETVVVEQNRQLQEKNEVLEEKEMFIQEQKYIVQQQELLTSKQDDKIRELEKTIVEKNAHLVALKNESIQAIENLNKQISKQKTLINKNEYDLNDINNLFQEQRLNVEVLSHTLDSKEIAINQLTNDLNKIYTSRGWRLINRLWDIRLFILPHGSKREKALKSIITGIPILFTGQWFRKIIKKPRLFQDYYIDQDNSIVTLYTDNPEIFPDYFPRSNLSNTIEDHLQISLIVSIKNELKNIEGWFDDISNQTRLPQELIIVDGGSTDGTIEKLQQITKDFNIPINLIPAKGSNRAEGRNIAIRNARFPIIAVTDFGCRIHKDWLEKIIHPFLIDPETRVSSGYYQVKGVKDQLASQNRLWADLQRVHPSSFLPSSRSVAFVKSVFEAVGGYPEWLETTGEDTYFDLELKRYGGKWAFIPEAIVEWQAPKTLSSFFKKNFEWAVGDGESGVHAQYYWLYVEHTIKWFLGVIGLLGLFLLIILLPIRPILIWLSSLFAITLVIFAVAIKKSGLGISLLIHRLIGEIPQILGFLKGAKRRKMVEQKRLSRLKGIVYILAGVPIDDTGGGSRGAQIALELLRKGYAVIYINKFPKYENGNLNLRITHPNLFTYPFSDFDFDKFKNSHLGLKSQKNIGAIIEFPMKEFFPLIEKIKDEKGRVIYDLLDDWQTSLGGDWYSRENEETIITLSDKLVGTIPTLCKRLSEMSKRQVTLIPNAVNSHLFDPSREYARPEELPTNKRIVTYIGALWGEWFDWQLLTQIAIQYPNDCICVIGDYRNQLKNPAKNLRFLGLKPQQELPAFLAFTDVAIIPWRISPITQNTSPLKLYEYLSMGCPVVVPKIKALEGIPGVYLARDQKEFIKLIGQLNHSKPDLMIIKSFIDENNWAQRVNQFIDLFGFNTLK